MAVITKALIDKMLEMPDDRLLAMLKSFCPAPESRHRGTAWEKWMKKRSGRCAGFSRRSPTMTSGGSPA